MRLKKTKKLLSSVVALALLCAPVTADAGYWAESSCRDTSTGYRCTYRSGEGSTGPYTEQNVAIIGISMGIVLVAALITLVIITDSNEQEEIAKDTVIADDVYIDIAPWCKDMKKSERAQCLVDYSTR